MITPKKTMLPPTILSVKNLCHEFQIGGEKIALFKNLNLQLRAGDAVALLGASGAGKTTLLNLLGLMTDVQSGTILLHGKDISDFNSAEKNHWRGRAIGFVFQHHYLIDELTALQNVAMPLLLLKKPKKIANARAALMLEQVGLSARLRHYPSQLSGGERQRVAVARALVHEPSLLLADEPTGNLDPENADKVFKILLKEISSRNMSALIATHDWQRAKQLKKQLLIKDKKLLGSN